MFVSFIFLFLRTGIRRPDEGIKPVQRASTGEGGRDPRAQGREEQHPSKYRILIVLNNHSV